VLGDSGVLAATVQFQYFPDCTVLASTRLAAAVPGRVRECLILPTHCSCNKDKKSAKSSQLTARVTKARTQCWLILRSPGGPAGGSAPPHVLTPMTRQKASAFTLSFAEEESHVVHSV